MVTVQVQRKVNIDLDKVLAQLKKKAVYVGIPKENSKRSDGEMTNASLLMIHSKGSPLRNLPARPVIEPAIEEETNKAKISRQLIAAANKGLNGDQAGFITGLNAAGLQAQNVCREWFKNPKNGWDPLAPSTIQAKVRKYGKGKKKIDTSSIIPLVDTGEMRKAITYVLRDT
jgi:hypothetical protein